MCMVFDREQVAFTANWAIKSDNITSAWVIYVSQSRHELENVVNAIKRRLPSISIGIHDSIRFNRFLRKFTELAFNWVFTANYRLPSE